MKIFTVKENCDLRTFTDSVYPQGSFCLARLLRARDVKINGVRTGKNMALRQGDTVAYYTTRAQESKPSHTVIYEDENIVVCDKFSGVTSEGLCSELNSQAEYFAVHRLDRNTQGLIVFAKTREAERALLEAFRERNIHKTYIALCKNAFKKPGATLTCYMIKDDKTGVVTIFDTPRKGALTAVTEYAVKENRLDVALVEITLHTGRTHQIRAHLAHIGCPVLGDGKYGDVALNDKYNAKRQKLVSKRLSFNLTGGLSYLNAMIFESNFTL